MKRHIYCRFPECTLAEQTLFVELNPISIHLQWGVSAQINQYIYAAYCNCLSTSRYWCSNVAGWVWRKEYKCWKFSVSKRIYIGELVSKSQNTLIRCIGASSRELYFTKKRVHTWHLKLTVMLRTTRKTINFSVWTGGWGEKRREQSQFCCPVAAEPLKSEQRKHPL